MSSSKHKHNRNHAAASSHSHQKSPEIIPLSKLTDSFEKSQFLCLQYIIDKLSENIIANLNDSEKNDPAAMQPQLRIYAQYMNLYMKFKNKCIDVDSPNPNLPKPNPAPQTHSETKITKPDTNIHHTQNRMNTVVEPAGSQTNTNRLHPLRQQSALLMQPENESMENGKRE